MNREINYIVQAAFLLSVIGAGTWLVTRIPVDKTPAGQEILIDPEPPITISPEKASLIGKGKMILYAKCASCHHLFKGGTGPSLATTITQERWKDRDKLLAWINDPVAFMKTDKYTRELKEIYGSLMPAFPSVTRADVDAIVEYIEWEIKPHGY